MSFSLAAATADARQRDPEPPVVSPDLKRLSIEELAELDVTSVSRRVERLSQTAAAVTVIRQEDIRRSGATSIADAMRLADSLDVARSGARNWSISARGFTIGTANKLLVLMDGRTLYSPLFAGILGRAGHRAGGHHAHRGRAWSGGHHLRSQRRQRRHQHHHAGRLGDPRERGHARRRHGEPARHRGPAWRAARRRRGQLPRVRQVPAAGSECLRQRRVRPGPDDPGAIRGEARLGGGADLQVVLAGQRVPRERGGVRAGRHRGARRVRERPLDAQALARRGVPGPRLLRPHTEPCRSSSMKGGTRQRSTCSTAWRSARGTI
ncbi:MAG: TonB-dependent receptor plug domain-containing protein [Acidobacteria bacterium]|nr:TonB-dependent receptor plug domain-containing protein [Acidobacteriota bacterium]